MVVELKTIPAQEKALEKKPWKRSPGEKNRTSAVYSPGPVFDVKKILDKLLPTK